MDLDKLPILPIDKKRAIRDKVIYELLGDKPELEKLPNYVAPKLQKSSTHSTYPIILMRTIYLLTILFFIASFAISGLRMYQAGSEFFCKSADITLETRLVVPMLYPKGIPVCGMVGVFTAILSETGMVMFALMGAIMGQNSTAKVISYFGSLTALLLTFAGNIYVAEPFHHSLKNGEIIWYLAFFSWIECLAPPLMTSFTAYMGERYIMDDHRDSHRKLEQWKEECEIAETSYKNQEQESRKKWEEDLKLYKERKSNPIEHFGDKYYNTYYLLLEEELPKFYIDDRNIDVEVVSNFTATDWDKIIQRELERDMTNRAGRVHSIQKQVEIKESHTAFATLIDGLYHGKTQLNPNWISPKGFKRESSALKEAMKYESTLKN